MTIRAPTGIQLWNHFNDIWLYRTYTAGGYEINSGSIVIDIGANIGLFSLFASRYAGKVYSFEPHPSSYDYLVSNINSNNIANVECFNCAVGAMAGQRRLYTQPELTSNSFYGDTQRQADSIVVQCKTLQEVFDANGIAHCAFLKLDCEGSEFEIVFGTPRDYLARVSVISAECHDELTEYTHADMEDYLEALGFLTEVTMVRGNTAVLRARNRNR